MKNPIGIHSGPMLDPEGTGRRLRAMGASAVDPFGLPSAAVGLLSPETRDSWRATYEADPQGQILGSIAGAGAMMNIPSAASRLWGMLLGGATGAGSDMIDQATGNGRMDRNTAINAAIGAALYPVKPRVPKGAR